MNNPNNKAIIKITQKAMASPFQKNPSKNISHIVVWGNDIDASSFCHICGRPGILMICINSQLPGTSSSTTATTPTGRLPTRRQSINSPTSDRVIPPPSMMTRRKFDGGSETLYQLMCNISNASKDTICNTLKSEIQTMETELRNLEGTRMQRGTKKELQEIYRQVCAYRSVLDSLSSTSTQTATSTETAQTSDGANSSTITPPSTPMVPTSSPIFRTPPSSVTSHPVTPQRTISASPLVVSSPSTPPSAIVTSAATPSTPMTPVGATSSAASSASSTPATPRPIRGGFGSNGACKKGTCKKCFEKHDWDWNSYLQHGDWECTHCRQCCPDDASCMRTKRLMKKRKQDDG